MDSLEAKELIDKLEASAKSEAALGNNEAASAFEQRILTLRKKFNLPAQQTEPDPAKAPEVAKPREPDQPVKTWDQFSNFPGVRKPDGPLTNQQLGALRDAARAAGGRPLTDNEVARVLGKEETPYEKQRRAECEILYI